MIPVSMIGAQALQQVAGPISVELKPGESQTIEWGLISDKSTFVTSLKLHAEGSGSEFLSFPETLLLKPNEVKFVKVQVFVPDDFPGNIEYTPHLIATESGEKGGATIINIRMLKIVSLDIAPNDDPSLWVNWEELKQEEDVKLIAPTVEKSEGSGGLMILPGESGESEPTCGAGTVLKNGLCVLDETKSSSKGGGCLIATATYGSELAPQVQLLREIRDTKILETESGSSFMSGFNQFYYSFSPTIADLERESPVFKESVKLTITPLLASLSLLNNVEINSEQDILGYGIGVILLNVGMYFAAPVIIISKINKIRKNHFKN